MVEVVSEKGSSRGRMTANTWNAVGGNHFMVSRANRKVLSMHCYLIRYLVSSGCGLHHGNSCLLDNIEQAEGILLRALIHHNEDGSSYKR